MCNAFTSLLMRDGRVLWEPAEDSHSALMGMASVRDGVIDGFRARNFLKMESLPPYWDSKVSSERSDLTARDALSQYFGDEFKVTVDDESVHWYSPRHEDAVREATFQWRDKVVVDRIDRKILDPDLEPPFALEYPDIDSARLELATKEFYYHYRMFGFDAGGMERLQLYQDNDYGMQRAMSEYIGDTLSKLIMMIPGGAPVNENGYGSFSASGWPGPIAVLPTMNVAGKRIVIPSNFRSPGRNAYMAQGRSAHSANWWGDMYLDCKMLHVDMEDTDGCGDHGDHTYTKRLQMGRAMSILWLSSFLKPIGMSNTPGTGSKQTLFGSVDRNGDLVHAANAVRAIGDQGYIVEGMSVGGDVYLANGENKRVYRCRDTEENVRADMRIRERSNEYSMGGISIDNLKWS